MTAPRPATFGFSTPSKPDIPVCPTDHRRKAEPASLLKTGTSEEGTPHYTMPSRPSADACSHVNPLWNDGRNARILLRVHVGKNSTSGTSW